MACVESLVSIERRLDRQAIDQLRDVIAAEPESPAYRSGWGARIHGAERQDNPNPSGMDKAQWNKGWDAFDDWAASQI